MRYEVIWEPEALAQAGQLAKSDPQGVRQAFTAVDRLADNPRPDGAFDSADVLRIHVGIYRVMYEINDQQIRVSVIHLDRTHLPRRLLRILGSGPGSVVSGPVLWACGVSGPGRWSGRMCGR
ncbi:type II toxin-antitoxin system RelE family toxin, partial [Streptomyces sp. NPDC055036]